MNRTILYTNRHTHTHARLDINIPMVWNNMRHTDSIFTWTRDDVIKWNHFTRHWPFVRGIHRSPEFPSHRPVTQSFNIFWSVSEQTVEQTIETWWFGTPLCSLWRHRNSFFSAFVTAQCNIMKRKHFPCYRAFVRGIHRWPVVFP